MPTYRIMTLDRNGIIVGASQVTCVDDASAVAFAQEVVMSGEYAMILDGDRQVAELPGYDAVGEEIEPPSLLRSVGRGPDLP